MRTIGISGGIGPVGASMRKRPRWTAALIAGAVLTGIYLGSTTVAEINPFYRQGRVQAGSSYTSDGWRGADAVLRPADQVPTSDDHRGRFMSGVYAWAPAGVRDFAEEVSAARDVAEDVAAVGRAVGETARSLDGVTETLVPDAPPPADLSRPTSHAAQGGEVCDPAYDRCPAGPPSPGDEDADYPDGDYPAFDGPAA